MSSSRLRFSQPLISPSLLSLFSVLLAVWSLFLSISCFPPFSSFCHYLKPCSHSLSLALSLIVIHILFTPVLFLSSPLLSSPLAPSLSHSSVWRPIPQCHYSCSAEFCPEMGVSLICVSEGHITAVSTQGQTAPLCSPKLHTLHITHLYHTASGARARREEYRTGV